MDTFRYLKFHFNEIIKMSAPKDKQQLNFIEIFITYNKMMFDAVGRNPNVSLQMWSDYNTSYTEHENYNKKINFIKKGIDYMKNYYRNIKNYKYPLNIYHNTSISANPNLRITDVLNNLNYEWDWYDLSKNPSITLQHIIEYNNLPWNLFAIASRPDLSDDFTRMYLTDKNINNFFKIIEYPGNEIEDNTMWRLITSNPNLSIEFILKEYIDTEKIDVCYIANHPNFTIEYINKYINNYVNINVNENMNNFNLFLDSRHLFINNLSSNKNITIDFIIKYKNCNWIWEELVWNANITILDIFNNFDLPWKEYWWIHPDVMPEHLISKNDYDIQHWMRVSENPKVSMEYIFNNRHLPWHWIGVSNNPNLTIDIICKHPEIKLDYYAISMNQMTYDPKLYNIKTSNIINKTTLIITGVSRYIIDYV